MWHCQHHYTCLQLVSVWILGMLIFSVIQVWYRAKRSFRICFKPEGFHTWLHSALFRYWLWDWMMAVDLSFLSWFIIEKYTSGGSHCCNTWHIYMIFFWLFLQPSIPHPNDFVWQSLKIKLDGWQNYNIPFIKASIIHCRYINHLFDHKTYCEHCFRNNIPDCSILPWWILLTDIIYHRIKHMEYILSTDWCIVYEE